MNQKEIVNIQLMGKFRVRIFLFQFSSKTIKLLVIIIVDDKYKVPKISLNLFFDPLKLEKLYNRGVNTCQKTYA